jgi:hypothetical protein
MTRLTTGARAGFVTALTFASLSAGAALVLLAADARVLHAQAAAANRWSLGTDASVSTYRYTFDGQKNPRVTSFDLPRGDLRLGYRVSPMLQLEVPFSFSAFWSDGTNFQGGSVGLNANLFVAPRATVRPFVGIGTGVQVVRLTTAIIVDDQVIPIKESTESQYGVSARAGFDWQAFRMVSFRPTLFYERQFERTSHDLAGRSEFGATFGSTVHFGPQAAGRTAMPLQLSLGGALSRASFGSIDGGFGNDTPPSITLFQLPSVVVGLFVPVSANGRAMVGANVAASHGSDDDFSQTSVTLQPRVELNLNPRFRTERSARLGLHGNYELARERFSTTDATSASRLGAGADISATFPTRGGLLSRIGVGYDYLAKNNDNLLPSQSQFSLKFGIDAL